MLSTASVQLSVYLSPSIYEYAVKFCFDADHAAVLLIIIVTYEQRCPVPYIQHTLCVLPLCMDNYYP